MSTSSLSRSTKALGLGLMRPEDLGDHRVALGLRSTKALGLGLMRPDEDTEESGVSQTTLNEGPRARPDAT